METLMSVPDIGELDAATLLIEMDNFRDLSSEDKLASCLEIILDVHQPTDNTIKPDFEVLPH